jgi:Cytochrome P450
VEESFILPIRDAKGTSTSGYLIPGGSRVICATRAAHLSDAIWGNNPSIWDGERFLERDDDEAGMKSKKAREMRGFGGGVSIVRFSLIFSNLQLLARILTRNGFSVKAGTLHQPNSKPLSR